MVAYNKDILADNMTFEAGQGQIVELSYRISRPQEKSNYMLHSFSSSTMISLKQNTHYIHAHYIYT